MPTNFNFQPKGFRSELGWYDRGYIPHFDGGEISQFLTFRLFDSLPQEIVQNGAKKHEIKAKMEKRFFVKMWKIISIAVSVNVF